MARTTVRLPDDLLREAKRIASESGRNLTSVIQDALRESFLRREATPKKKKVKLPVWRGRLRPGVDLDSQAALLELMDQDKIDRLYRQPLASKPSR